MDEEIIEEIFIDTDPLTPSCDEIEAIPRLVEPEMEEETCQDSSDQLDIYNIKHYDNCNENEGKIIPLNNIDVDRLHKVASSIWFILTKC